MFCQLIYYHFYFCVIFPTMFTNKIFIVKKLNSQNLQNFQNFQ